MEYLQLASLINISLNQHLYSQTDQGKSLPYQAMTYFPKLINPGYLLSFQKDWTTSIAVICIIGLLSLLRYCLFLHILLVSMKRRQCNQYLLEVSAWVFRLQGRVIYSIITSYWINLALTILQSSYKPNYGGHRAIMALPIVLTLIEFTFSFYLQLCFCSVLPNKNMLTAKTNLLELLTLIHKLALQMLQLGLSLSSIRNTWFIVSLNLALFLLRDIYYFKVIPFYKMRAILYVGGLLMMTTSLNLAYLLQMIIISSDQENEISLVIIIWIILGLLMIKVSSNHLHQVIRSTVSSFMRGSVERLVHRVSIIKQLREEKSISCSPNSDYAWTYLMNIAINANTKHILSLDTFSGDKVNINNKEARTRQYTHYLETLLQLFPKNELLRLYTAYFYIKEFRMYWRGIKTISGLEKSGLPHIRLNVSLLVYEAQKTIRASHAKQLNVLQFMRGQTYISNLKTQMLNHAKLQFSICEEVISENPNPQRISQHTQSLDRSRINLEKQIKLTLDAIPDYCIEPLKFIGRYHLTLNHSHTESKKYNDLFERRYRRYERYYALDNLCEENFYQASNCYAILSGQKSDLGKFLLCSESIEDVYGGQASSYIGTELFSLALPCLSNFYASCYKLVLENGEAALFNRIIHTYGFRRDGYVIQSDCYLTIHPFTCGGLYFDLISRRVYSSNDFLFITENGELDCASERVAKRLKTLFPLGQPRRNPVHISSVSTKLAMINKAFNMIAYPAKYPPKEESAEESSQPNDNEYDLTLREAQELYTAYTTEEQNIILNPIGNDEENLYRTPFSYKCKVENTFYGPILLKLVTLEEVKPPHNMKSPLPQKSGKSVRKPNYHIAQMKTSDSSAKIEDSDFFEYNNEKETGWINVPTTCQDLLPNKPLTKRQENIISFTERNSEQPGDLVTRNTITVKEPHGMTSKASYSKGFLDTNQDHSVNVRRVYTGGSSIDRSQIFNDSQQRQISHAYEAALAVKYYPISLKVFYVFICIAIVAIIIGQIALSSTMQTNIDNFQLKKEILKSSQLRDYLLVNTQTGWLQLLLYNDNKLAEAMELPPFERFQPLVQETILKLASTNTLLLKDTNYLDDITRQILFEKTIKVYNNITKQQNDYTYLNTFELIDRLVVTSLRTASINFSQQTDEQVETRMIFGRAMNDLLLRTQAVSTSTYHALDMIRNSILADITKNYIIELCLLATITLMTTMFIIKLYLEEKNNMDALVRLNKQRVEHLMADLEDFKKFLETDRGYERKSFMRTKKLASIVKNPNDRKQRNSEQ